MGRGRRALSFLVSPLCPPLGPLVLGQHRVALVVAVVALPALAVFFLLSWGLGALLWAAAVALAWAGALFLPAPQLSR